MQLSPFNSSISNLVPSSGAIAVVLPKEGETPVNALFSPVTEVQLSTRSRPANQDADTYERLVKQRKADHESDESSNKQTSTVTQATTEQAANSISADPAERASQQAGNAELDDRDMAMLRELQVRDQEVRNHEQAHMSSGGSHSGAASFTYQTGPDGVRYAVGGEVPVDLSTVKNDPQATLEKMQQIQQAALAPAEPSAQDRQVAAEAGQIAMRAMAELADEKRSQQAAAQDALQQAEQVKEARAKEELEQAKDKQQKAEEKEQQDQAVSTAERFAEYNAKLARLNQTLLELSLPKPISAGQLLNQIV